MNELARKKCVPCEGGVDPLTPQQIGPMLKGLQGWALEAGEIVKTYRFRNYFLPVAFVNATAWISHREDHHPELRVGYDDCRVAYHTDAINDRTVNDFVFQA